MEEITLIYRRNYYKCSYDGVYVVHRFIDDKGGLLRIREHGLYLDPEVV